MRCARIGGYGAGSKNWSRVSELEQGVRIGAGRQNLSQVTLGGEGDGDIASQLRNREKLYSGE